MLNLGDSASSASSLSPTKENVQSIDELARNLLGSAGGVTSETKDNSGQKSELNTECSTKVKDSSCKKRPYEDMSNNEAKEYLSKRLKVSSEKTGNLSELDPENKGDEEKENDPKNK